MEVETFFKSSQYNRLKCDYNSVLHVFVDPIKLSDCGNIYCKECIEKIQKEGKCKCGSKHEKFDLTKAVIDEKTKKDLDDNSKKMTDEIIDKLLVFVESTESSKENQIKKITELCNQVREEIRSRVEDIKAHLSSLDQELKKKLADIKKSVDGELDKLNQEINTNTKNFETFAAEMQKRLDNFEANKIQLEKDIYTCEEHIAQLHRLDERFHKIISHVKFEPGNWLPNASYIGRFTFPNINDDASSSEEVSPSTSGTSVKSNK